MGAAAKTQERHGGTPQGCKGGWSKASENGNQGRFKGIARRGDGVKGAGWNRLPVMERFWAQVMPEPNSGCWLWLGCLQKGASKGPLGYGVINHNKKKYQAHRFSYERLVGPIEPGLEIDHLCRMPCCVNPDHLEPVTHAVNVSRGRAREACSAFHLAKTHCPRGHPYSGENLIRHKDGRRACRECGRMHARNYWRKKSVG